MPYTPDDEIEELWDRYGPGRPPRRWREGSTRHRPRGANGSTTRVGPVRTHSGVCAHQFISTPPHTLSAWPVT